MKIYAEIPFFLVIFSFMLSGSVTTNLIIYRTCYLIFGFNQTECGLLGSGSNSTSTLELQVQPYAAVLELIKTLTETVISSFLCFFLGAWSDKYGRRPIMLFALGGYTVGFIIMALVSALPNVSPWFLLLSSIPVCCVGGFPAFLTVTICYISDTTTNEERATRMGIFDAILTAGALLGISASSFIFNSFGYVATYAVTTLCIFTAWVLVKTSLPESVRVTDTKGRFRNMFKFSLIADSFKATFKKRNGHDRALLLTMVSLVVIFLLARRADDSVLFLYLRRKLNWSLRKYTLFKSGRKLAWIGGNIAGGYCLHRFLKIREPYLIMSGFVSTMTSALLQGFATTDWHVYTAGATRCFGGIISPMSRSLISKIVSTEDSGKVFSFAVATETLANLMGSPFYTFLYNKTIVTLPGAFNFVTAGIYFAEIILCIPAIIMQRRRHRGGYLKIGEEESSD